MSYQGGRQEAFHAKAKLLDDKVFNATLYMEKLVEEGIVHLESESDVDDEKLLRIFKHLQESTLSLRGFMEVLR